MSALTPHQADMVALSILGYNNREIGERLGVAYQTVWSTLNNARGKLHIRPGISFTQHYIRAGDWPLYISNRERARIAAESLRG